MPEAVSAVNIDGSYGEGGGALVRMALAMAAATHQPVYIENIRAGSRFPGLDAEDLTLANALATLTDAVLDYAELGTGRLLFRPQRPVQALNGSLHTLRSASGRGSNACVLASILIPLLATARRYSTVKIDGETYGTNCLSFDALRQSTLRAFQRFGIYAYPTQREAGFGRDSQGEIEIDVEPCALQPAELTEKGALQRCGGTVAAAGVNPATLERARNHLTRLAQNVGIPLDIEVEVHEARSSGFFVTLWAEYESAMGSGGAMGARGLRAETVAHTAFDELYQWVRNPSALDPYLADQVLLPALLAPGETRFTVTRLTPRFLTMVWVVKQFLPIHITVRGAADGPGTVSIRRA
jgi:RNA 3'-terminal phosphate cyclase (ATP)